ncbi:hypothetical protein [Streptomyces sp. NPDC058623]|uniref:hypothetical protein n=1 Tax=Streptomyces sp. NPDC058623 TaxID=3346563 RepID=UPI00365989FC
MEEEGYRDPESGSRYSPLRPVLPDGWACPVLLVVPAAVCGYVMGRGGAGRGAEPSSSPAGGIAGAGAAVAFVLGVTALRRHGAGGTAVACG